MPNYMTRSVSGCLVAALVFAAAATGVAHADTAQRGHSATIRYTEYGVPHVRANDYVNLGFGQGYAAARDNLCAIADGTVTLSGQRSLFHGPDARPGGNEFASSMTEATTNLASDLYFQQINDSGVVERLVTQPAPIGPRTEVREMVRGYVAGFNRLRREQPSSRCTGAAWLRSMTEHDVYRRLYAWALFFGQAGVADALVSAQPPGPSTVDAAVNWVQAVAASASLTSQPNGLGSNAIAIGAAATANGHGLMLGNPHLPWHGDARLWQVHLTIPGRLDVSGAAPLGLPFVFFGHNETVAWGGAASTAVPYTLFELTLVVGAPTTYLVDGRPEPMQRRDVSVRVRQPDGGLTTVTQPQWWTRYGPVVGPRLGGLSVPWTAGSAQTGGTAYVLADANTQNMRLGNLMLAFAEARSSEGIVHALRKTQGSSSFNILATDSRGAAVYADIQVVPHVTDEHAARCNTTLGRAIFPASGLAVLDGSRSECEWGRDADAVQPGTFGPHRLPLLRRADYVESSNESHWLTSPGQTLSGFPRILGAEATERFPRTRSAFVVIADQLAQGTFTRQAMQDLMLANRNYAAELTVSGTVEMCRSLPDGVASDSTGKRVNVSEACQVLARWDRRNDVGSRGVLLFDEYWNLITNRFRPGQWGTLWTVPFDPADPVHTPRTLNTAHPALPAALADAVNALAAAGIPLDAPLGDHQYVVRTGRKVPIGGGDGRSGVVNNIEAVRDQTGASEVRWGSSYIFVTSFDGDRCPDTRTLLTYSQSADPTSAHHSDQTELFATNRWVTERFCEEDIRTSPGTTTVIVEQR